MKFFNADGAWDREMDAARAALRDGGSMATDAVEAASAGLNNDVADWRKTECVVESDGHHRWRIRDRHIMFRVWDSVLYARGDGAFEGGWVGGYGGYWYDVDEVVSVLASIPDSARPSVPDSVRLSENVNSGEVDTSWVAQCDNEEGEDAWRRYRYGVRHRPTDTVLVRNYGKLEWVCGDMTYSGLVFRTASVRDAVLREAIREGIAPPEDADAAVRPDPYDGGCADDTEQVVSKFLGTPAGRETGATPAPSPAPPSHELCMKMLQDSNAMALKAEHVAGWQRGISRSIQIVDDVSQRTGNGPLEFLDGLASECERAGTEYGKGRAEGLREAVKEFRQIRSDLARALRIEMLGASLAGPGGGR